jgi:hypothetical protein
VTGKKLLLVAIASGLLVALTPLAALAAPNPSRAFQDDGCTHPMALMLSEWMEGVSCEDIMALHDEQDIGFGVMMKAYLLSDAFGLDWRDMVARHMSEEGLGWGHIMKAHVLASALGAEVSADDLLALRAEGIGWGQILKEYREGQGKPPWAGQGKPPWAGQGKPPWAGPHRPEEPEE